MRKSKATLAALKGWRTRRARAEARSRAAKKGHATRKAVKSAQGAKKAPSSVKQAGEQRIYHLVTIDMKGTGKKPSYGKRDFLVPAPRSASFKDLKRITEKTLTGPERQLLQFFKSKNATVSEGPKTTARKAQLR